MSLPFFVYVVESPSATDIYHQRSESEMLRRAAALNDIPCFTRCAINHLAFSAAILIGLKEEMKGMPGRFPILHISAHGNSEGIQLSSEEVLTWAALADLLTPPNKAMQNSLIVVMSCCEGFAGIRMAMRDPGTDLPFFAIVGCPEKPTWSETAVGYAAFYHHLARDAHITAAVQALRAASGRETFFIEWGESTRQSYIEFAKNKDAEKAKADVTAIAEAQPPEIKAQMDVLEKGG